MASKRLIGTVFAVGTVMALAACGPTGSGSNGQQHDKPCRHQHLAPPSRFTPKTASTDYVCSVLSAGDVAGALGINQQLTSTAGELLKSAPNDTTPTTNLSKPDSTARFTFNGVAGQRIYVDIPHGDLPSECGVLALKQPDGSTLTSGCIINNVGNLDDSGTISLVNTHLYSTPVATSLAKQPSVCVITKWTPCDTYNCR
ncbi:MAG: hypothetical protein ACQR33_02085 [Candidatus Saccharibacteria bacterium]